MCLCLSWDGWDRHNRSPSKTGKAIDFEKVVCVVPAECAT